MCAYFQVRIVEEFRHAHPRIAGNLNLAHPCLRSGDNLEGDVDELLIRMLSQCGSDLRLVKSVFGQRLFHLHESIVQLGLGKAGTGSELAGALQLRVERRALGSVHIHGTDKGARGSEKDEGHTTLAGRTINLRALHMYRLVKAGRIELAETLPEVFRGQRLSLGLGKLAGEGSEAIRGNALKRNTFNRHAFPLKK